LAKVEVIIPNLDQLKLVLGCDSLDPP